MNSGIPEILARVVKSSSSLIELLSQLMHNDEHLKDYQDRLAHNFVVFRDKATEGFKSSISRNNAAISAHNYHVLRTTPLKDIRPGKWRRIALAKRTWAKRRPF
jgi:hypothetical protein